MESGRVRTPVWSGTRNTPPRAANNKGRPKAAREGGEGYMVTGLWGKSVLLAGGGVGVTSQQGQSPRQ